LIVTGALESEISLIVANDDIQMHWEQLEVAAAETIEAYLLQLICMAYLKVQDILHSDGKIGLILTPKQIKRFR
jgi:hypothetical protein